MFDFIDSSLKIQTVNHSDSQTGLCLELDGYLAGDSIFTLKQAVEPIFLSPTPPKLKLVMKNVKYMDSSGVGIIISIIQRMREVGGKMEIHGLSDVGRDLFQILKLASLHEIVTVNN